MLLEGDGKLCPLEIKKTATPDAYLQCDRQIAVKAWNRLSALHGRQAGNVRQRKSDCADLDDLSKAAAAFSISDLQIVFLIVFQRFNKFCFDFDVMRNQFLDTVYVEIAVLLLCGEERPCLFCVFILKHI